MKRFVSFSLVTSMMLSVTLAGAATINWGSAQGIASDSDVRTDGVLNYAISYRGPGTTTPINGVTFGRSFSREQIGLGAISNVGFTSQRKDGQYSTVAPFSDLSSGYQDLLSSWFYGFSNDISNVVDPDGIGPEPEVPGATIRMRQLTPGVDYLVQLWSNRSSAGRESNTQTTVDGNLIEGNSLGVEGALGQYIVGVFTADAATQDIALSEISPDTTRMVLNGIQVRAVPEPASVVLVLPAIPG